MTFFSATLYVNKLYHQSSPKIATAGVMGDFASSAWESIKSLVGGLWDGKRPLASALSFIGPGLLFAIPGLGWIGVAVEVAGALGFDWIGFWQSVIQGVSSLVQGLFAPNAVKPTEDEGYKQVKAITDQAFDQHSKGPVDEAKLAEIAKKSGATPLPAALGADTAGKIVKEALLGSILGRTTGLLGAMFKKVIPWVVTRGLFALGAFVAGKAVYDAISGKKPGEDGTPGTSMEREPIENLGTANLTPEMSEVHENGTGAVWLEQGNVGSIRSYLTSWILEVYPSLKDKIKDIQSSPHFIEVENMFKARNKMATGLQIYSVPKPFESKADIVSYVINWYLKTNKESNAPK